MIGGDSLCDMVDRLMWDPDLTGDTLLFAVAFAHATDPDRGPEGGTWVERVGARTGFSMDRIRQVIAADRPRYEVPQPDPLLCTVLVGSRVCGRPGESAGMLRDIRTGVGTWWSGCRRHAGAAIKVHARNVEAWARAGRPSPPPNRGGVLPRFFDEDWPVWYRWAAPSADPVPWAPEVPERPRLTVIRGGG